MKHFRPLAALVMLLACTGWAMAQQPGSSNGQTQGQNSTSQSSQAQQGQTTTPAQTNGQTGQNPKSQNPNAQNPNAAANPSGQAGTAHPMPATGSPLGLLLLAGFGAIGAGTAIRRRAVKN